MTSITIGKLGTKGSRKVTIDGDCIKLAGMKNPKHVGAVLGSLDKGEARKLRMALRSNGFPALAAARRVA